jgi:hypothetical protein
MKFLSHDHTLITSLNHLNVQNNLLNMRLHYYYYYYYYLLAKPFYGKQKSIKCSGPCASRFHLSCVHISDTEFLYYTKSGVSTYKCLTCMTVLRQQRSDDTPVKTRSSSTSDLPKKVISPERSLVIPSVMDTD